MATTYFTTTATQTYSANNAIVLTSIQNIFPGMSIVFSGNVFGNITANTVYFVENIPAYNEITISAISGGYPTILSNGTGAMLSTLSTGSQAIINTGAAPNDGTGAPLRTAFTETNYNFDQLFAQGPVGSNIQIADNSILTLNTNGNLILNPNGVGVVQANAHVVPDQNRIRNLGSSTLLWNTTYTQYLNTTFANIGTATIGNIGNLTIDVGNIHILGGTNGYVLQTDGTGNLTWTAQTGGSGNGVPGGANTQVQYNDAGAFGGTAGFTFDNTSNTLSVTNITASNISAPNGTLNLPGIVITTPLSLGMLTATAGARAFVNDGNLTAAGNFGAQISNGGSNIVPVWSDGTNWYIG